MADTYTRTGFTAGVGQFLEFGRVKDGAVAALIRLPQSGNDKAAEFELADPADAAKFAIPGKPVTITGVMEARYSQKANGIFIRPGKVTNVQLHENAPPLSPPKK